MKHNPDALSVVHVGKGIFYSRPDAKGEGNPMIAIRKDYEATGGKIIEHDQSTELFPGACAQAHQSENAVRGLTYCS